MKAHFLSSATTFYAEDAEDLRRLEQLRVWFEEYTTLPPIANRIKITEEVAVDLDYYWLPMNTCPRGVKVQLLNPGGVAIHGCYTGREHPPYEGWTPLPKRN
jgi:hypothetical protein